MKQFFLETSWSILEFLFKNISDQGGDIYGWRIQFIAIEHMFLFPCFNKNIELKDIQFVNAETRKVAKSVSS